MESKVHDIYLVFSLERPEAEFSQYDWNKTREVIRKKEKVRSLIGRVLQNHVTIINTKAK